MFGSAEVRLAATEHAVLVPAAAIVSIANGESSGVYVVERDVVRIRVVQPGEREGGMVRILSGIKAGDVVATANVDQLIDGARVRLDRAETRSERPGAPVQ
jgi:multidrug efflux pump subunit AcrA (membrane-fusion protein)